MLVAGPSDGDDVSPVTDGIGPRQTFKYLLAGSGISSYRDR